MSSPRGPASHLDRFPSEVRSAFAEFRRSGSPEALACVVTAIVESFRPSAAHDVSVTLDTALVADLSFDSIAIAETVFFFEDLFGVSINNNELSGLRTVRDLCDFIHEHAGGTTSST